MAAVAKRKEKQSKPIAKVSKKKLAESDGNIWAAGKIKPVSKAQARKDAIYFDRLPGWKLENPNCEYPGCNAQTEHCHHKRGRGKYYLIESTWCPLCAEHHRIVENFPDHAKEIGLSESRLAKYDDE